MDLQNRIRTVFFDLGNVLFAFDYGLFHRRASGGALPDAATELKLNALTLELECGRLAEEPFLAALIDLYPALDSTENALVCWSDIFNPIEATLAAVRRLRASGDFQLGVISNISVLHMRHLSQLSDVFACFDELILSYAVGSMKPDLEIYRVALSKAVAGAENCLFFDDRPENVAAARSLGVQAFQVTKPADIDELLASLNQ